MTLNVASKRSRGMAALYYDPLAGKETDPTLCSTLDVLLQHAQDSATAAWSSEGLAIGDIMYSLAPDSPPVLDLIAKWANTPSKITKNKAMRCMLLMEFAACVAAGYLPVFKMPKERSTSTKVDAWQAAGIEAPHGASLAPFPWLGESESDNLSGRFTQAIVEGVVHGKSAIGTDAVDKNGLVADGQRAVLSATPQQKASRHAPDGVVIVPIPRTLGLPTAMQHFLMYAKATAQSAKRHKKTERAEEMDLLSCSRCGDATKQGREVEEQVLCGMCWEDGWRFNGARLEEHQGAMDQLTCSHCGDVTKEGCVLEERALCAVCWEDGWRLNGARMEAKQCLQCGVTSRALCMQADNSVCETCGEAAKQKSKNKHWDTRPAPEAPCVSAFVSTTAVMSPLCPGQRAPPGPLHADNVLVHKAAFALLDLAAGPTSLSSALRVWPGA